MKKIFIGKIYFGIFLSILNFSKTAQKKISYHLKKLDTFPNRTERIKIIKGKLF